MIIAGFMGVEKMWGRGKCADLLSSYNFSLQYGHLGSIMVV